MFTLTVTHLQESSPVAPALPLPHLAWPFTHTWCAHTDAQIVQEGKMPQHPKKLRQPNSTLSLTRV